MTDSLFEQYKAALRRGHMAALAGELDDALAAYDAAARLVPERALPLASRGTVLHRLDRWPEAAEAFDRALQLAPDDEAALRARGSARAEREMRSGAAADFERLAFVLDVAGRAGHAAEAARRAADLEPSAARTALAERLGAAAAQLADLLPARGTPEPAAFEAGAASDVPPADEPGPDDPWSAALDQRRLEGLGDDVLAGGEISERAAENAAGRAPAEAPQGHRPVADGAAYDALDALRAGMDAGERGSNGTAAEGSLAAVERGPAEAPPAASTPAGDGTEGTGEAGAAGGAWPGIDLPSPPPPPIEGPPPDPEDLLTEAALVLEQGEVDAARDLMLTAARVHRDAGRIDAALEICLNLLTFAPGDPRVHLAIANLQLDRGWTGVATEKLDLLVRLTSLTGDTQAEADVHGLASERLRDEPQPSPAGR